MLIDAKPKVACVTEVASEQLVLLYLQATFLQNVSKRSAVARVVMVCKASSVKFDSHVEVFHICNAVGKDAKSIIRCSMWREMSCA